MISTGMSRRRGAALVAVAAAGAIVMTAGLGAAPALAAGLRADARAHALVLAHQPRVKYYVVPPATDGHEEFLYQIAAQVLGDGGRYGEIFQLNQGRVQPDGGRLQTPAAVDPGWILILPADAAGPGVHFGVLPGTPAAPAGRASAAAPAVQASPAGTASDPGPGQVVRSVLLTVTVIMLIAIAGIVSRRRRKSGRLAAQALTRPAAPARAAGPATFSPGLLAVAEAPGPAAEHRPAGGQAASETQGTLTLPEPAAPDCADEEDDDWNWPDYLS